MPLIAGRYLLSEPIASGGMATVHLGRLLGPLGFSRTVAIKRLHENFTQDPEFVAMFVDEARLAGWIRHPNVVATLDVVQQDGQVYLIMDYVHGVTLSHLMRELATHGGPAPPAIVSSIVSGALHGLHAAHEARGEDGHPLGIVHRDVSPQNLLVGTDGVTRVLDFGVAKAAIRMQTTREGQLKGKLAYMAPEQLLRGRISPATDIYAATVVLWEMLVGRQLFTADNEGAVIEQVLAGVQDLPGALVPGLPPELDDIVARGLDPDPGSRYANARDMATALEQALPPALNSRVGGWVENTAGETLVRQTANLHRMERIAPLGSPVPLARLPIEDVHEAPTIFARRPGAQTGRRRPMVWGGLIFAFGLLVASVLWWRTARGPAATPREAVAPAPGSGAGLQAPPRLPAGSAPNSVTQTRQVSGQEQPATAAAQAPMATPPHDSEPRPNLRKAALSKRGVRGAAGQRPGAAPDPCDPPYVRDAQGIIRFKRQCLNR